MSEQKQKVSDLPENEQKEIIAEAYAVGLKGFNFTSYKVETLKEKIAEAKANLGQQKDEQNDSNDEQNAENVNNDEENKSDESIPEEASDETKAFLNGETDELPEGAEVITEDEAQKLEQKADEPIPGEKLPTKEEPRKVNGICHICGSKVVEGVCTGCGFKKI